MAIKSYEEQLEAVQTAIDAIEGGAQSYTISGRALSRADLGTLYQREKYLRRMVDREAAGGKVVVKYGVFYGR
jgi:hypothetical protein